MEWQVANIDGVSTDEIYATTRVPELKPGEPRKGKIKSGKSGKKKMERKERNTWERKLYS